MKKGAASGMKIVLFAALAAVSGVAQANDLCAENPYTPSEAKMGKAAFDSRCALCHQFSMKGREPGNSLNEIPDINTLSRSDLEFMDASGGVVPALVGKKFFDKHKEKTLTEFSAFVSSAAISFPTAGLKTPDT